MAFLVLVRHGKSEWNHIGLWTGWTDIALHKDGEIDAQKMAKHLLDIKFDLVHCSNQVRAIKTAEIILEDLKTNLPIIQNKAFNERNYGIYTGKNKWQVKEEVGEEQFQNIRRGWDCKIPEGESLKDVYQRAVPYFQQEILPQLKTGKNVLVAASNNSLRALTKYLCNISDEGVCNLEIGIGEVHVYEFDPEGKIKKYKIRNENPNKGKI